MSDSGKWYGLLTGVVLSLNLMLAASLSDRGLIYLYITISSILLCLLGWRIGGLIGYSEKKRNQQDMELIKDKDRLYHALFANNTDGIVLLDKHGNIIDGNPALVKISGYTIDELREVNPETIVVPEDAERKLYHCRKAAAGVPQEFHLAIIDKTGKQRSVMVKMIPIMSREKVVGVFEIIKDLTESKKLEVFMRQSEKLSAVGQLAAGIAHEIRNPLTTLKGFIQLMQSELKSSYLEVMKSELERINFIVSEFLVLSRPHEVSFQLNNVMAILKDVVLLLEPQANLNNIQVKTNINGSVPQINCDANQLKQVFINLLKNAMEAMPEGGNIFVEGKVKEEEICIQMKDEGTGIPPEKIHKLGEPFYTTKKDGTGLGLLVSYRIIKKHGGQIIIESELNKGTQITILLPIMT
ncbi:two-component system, sporulation sensor kinase A/two-component system, sporulation sensor kinase E [Evansella caseinilytica]|uniref:histidine kinase n=1 Tax=Evansella caseinilytica TaxID=1503961 RepID=A0A1H3U699_9BACI|nr:ATP-binding protein [Evansella caseinilytica]SDZ58006.1 two-component system, sporulation sensor kinase A/two-component system, sporulation sensor kinase E [Evansella caseinilytica]